MDTFSTCPPYAPRDKALSAYSSAAQPSAAPERIKRKPIPRKGHKKSRKGCFACKKRKVKCTEQLPQCDQCKRLDLVCEYPALRYQGANENILATATLSRVGDILPAPTNGLRTTSTSFSMDDMRFFSHFILAAYPSLPLNGDQIWMDAAQMAHEYEPLMHAMLALGASHLTLCTAANFSSQALSHRIRAIQSINKMLSRTSFTIHDGDAAMGTMLALIFQSTLMPEGMLEFAAMVRGCYVLTAKGVVDIEHSSFRSFTRDEHISTFTEMMTEACAAIHTHTRSESLLASIRALAPMCKSIVELDYVAGLQKVLQLCAENSISAYAYLSDLYSRFGQMSTEEFASFTDPQNYTAQIIMANFFLVDQCIGEAISSDAEMAVNFRKHVVLIWVERVAASLPPEYKPYMEWTLDFARRLIKGSGPDLPSHWPKDPLQATTTALIQSGSGFFQTMPADDSSTETMEISMRAPRPCELPPTLLPSYDFNARISEMIDLPQAVGPPQPELTGEQILGRWKNTGIVI